METIIGILILVALAAVVIAAVTRSNAPKNVPGPGSSSDIGNGKIGRGRGDEL